MIALFKCVLPVLAVHKDRSLVDKAEYRLQLLPATGIFLDNQDLGFIRHVSCLGFSINASYYNLKEFAVISESAILPVTMDQSQKASGFSSH
jgi:hypothetical protein